MFARFPDGTTQSIATPTGNHCSIYKAEIEAILEGCKLIEEAHQDIFQVVFLTDALSVLQALTSDREQQLMDRIRKAGGNRRIFLQWIPAHCGIPGNELADQLAKSGARKDQPDVDLTYKERRTIIKSSYRLTVERDDYHLLSRKEQVTIFRLRTGHNRLNHHMYSKLRLVPSSNCSCGIGDQTVEHVLQSCPRFLMQRNSMWPQGTELDRKLHGCKEELRKTCDFINMTGLKV